MIGQRLGAYELIEEIGRGGMGVVYRAEQPSLRRTVAVKVLAPQLAADERFVQRFLREARAAARLEHPGIVTVYDVGEVDGTYYFAMRLLPGDSLAELLINVGRLEEHRAASVGIQVADALSYAHRENIFHRDIKPANILIDRNGRCVLTDFGIALAASETRLTRTGTSLGSPDYMAPEVIRGSTPDARADLYSLGIVLFQTLTGEAPYKGATAMAVVYQHIEGPIPHVRHFSPTVSEEMDRIVARLMAKEPDQRYPAAAEVVRDLLAVTGGVIPALPTTEGTGAVLPATPVSPTPTVRDLPTQRRRRPLLRLAATLVLIALVATAGYYLATERPWEQFLPGPPEETLEPGPDSEAGGPTPPGPRPGSEAEPREPPAAVRSIRVESDPAGARILVDGTDQGLVTPAFVELAAADGEEVEIELLLDGETVASRRMIVAADMPESWRAVIAAAESFSITSQPAGATVTLSGERLEQTTPVAVDLVPGRDYRLRLELADHEPTGMEFTLEGLPSELRSSRTLHFPLTPAIPPGFLALEAAYPGSLRVAGRRFEFSAPGRRIDLPPGDYEAEVEAPSVYYSGRHPVRIASRERTVLELPPAVRVSVAAAPSHCRVAIDGRDVDFVPFTAELAVGTHVFEFRWENLQISRRIEQIVTSDTRRVFAAAGEEGSP